MPRLCGNRIFDKRMILGDSSFEQAAAKQETHTAAKPPETECKNFDRFIEFYFAKQIKLKFVLQKKRPPLLEASFTNEKN